MPFPCECFMRSLEKIFLHKAHQIWPNNRTSKHIPSNNFSLGVEFICTTMSNLRGDAMVCYQLRSFAHNSWVNCLLFDIAITSSCTRIQTYTETLPYIPQRIWEQTVAFFYLDGNKSYSDHVFYILIGSNVAVSWPLAVAWAYSANLKDFMLICTRLCKLVHD